MKSSSDGLASSDASCMMRLTAVERRLTFGRLLDPDAADMVSSVIAERGIDMRQNSSVDAPLYHYVSTIVG